MKARESWNEASSNLVAVSSCLFVNLHVSYITWELMMCARMQCDPYTRKYVASLPSLLKDQFLIAYSTQYAKTEGLEHLSHMNYERCHRQREGPPTERML